MRQLMSICSVLMVVLLVTTGCRPQDEHLCEEYCDEMVDCAETINQLESRSACERECFDDLERYETVRCEDDYLDLVDCKHDLSCTEEYDVGTQCAGEIDRLDRCIQ